MLIRMRKFLIVISVLILLLAAAIGGGYVYVHYQLSQLPVENLNYKIAGIGYKHIRLAEVSFTYIEPTRNVDALSTGFRSGKPAFKAPVRLNDVFVTWQWHGFSPNVQIVEVGHLDLTLSHWPAPSQQRDENEAFANWQLPTNWRVQDNIPHSLEVKDFVVDLPCADRCYYSGSITFASDNKEGMLGADEPQRSQLNLSLSPHQQFHEMEQLNIYLDYRVTGALPELDIVVQSPMALNIESTHHLDRTNRLYGQFDMQLEPSAHWVFKSLWQWWPSLKAQSEPIIGFLSDSLEISAAYQSALPDSPLERWKNEISAEFEAEIALHEQLLVNIDTQLYRDDQISFEGSLDTTLLPALRSNLRPLLPPSDAAADSPFLPKTILDQVNEPVTLRLGWELQFPPGTAFSSWANQADGNLAIEFASDNEFNFEQFAVVGLSSQAEIRLAAGLVENLDWIVAGGFDLLTFTEQLSQFTLDPDRVHWSMHVNTEDFIDWADLPIHVQAQSTGNSDIMLDARLRADLEGLFDSAEDTELAQLAVRSERGQIMLQQPELHMGNVHARDIQFELPFAIQFSPNDGLRIDAATPAQLQMTLSMPLNDDLLQTPQLELAFSEWQWFTPMDAIAGSRFSSQLDIHANSLEAPALLTSNWRWLGSFSAEPFREQPTVQANGRLTNSAGLVLRQQLTGSSQALTLDWQLADIFWLAGNPIAATLDDLWPELLTLQRGRTRAAGQVLLPFNDTPLSFNAEVELLDVAGIYDTASFSGVRAQLRGQSDGDTFSIELEEGYLQRIQYGMSHGPGEIQLSYQSDWAAPLAGQLEIKDNRLSVLNGVVSLLPASYELSQPEHTFYVDISQIDLARLLAEYPAADIQGSGLLSGNIPVRYSPQGIFVDKGRISALPPGGQLQYRSERAQQMAQSNMAMGVVMNALDDFHYSALQGDVTYLEDGTLQLGLLIEGRNPNLERGRPVRLEVTLQEDFPALLTSLQLTNQLNELIQERIQQRLIQGLRN